jgi:hypothetical protein
VSTVADVYHVKQSGYCVMHTEHFANVAAYVAREGGSDTFTQTTPTDWSATGRWGTVIHVRKDTDMAEDTWLA